MDFLLQLEYETLLVHLEVMAPFTGSFEDLISMRNDATDVYQAWGFMHRN